MDYLSILYWWIFLFLLGLINYPFSFILLRKNSDRGYGLSKIISLLLISYILLLGSSLKLFPFTIYSSLSALLLLVFVNTLIFLKNKREIIRDTKLTIRLIIFQEILFSSALLFWSFIKMHNPDIRSLEKFMDYGFINSILKSPWQPAQDMWFAGGKINYYYFGHFYTAVATRLSFLPSSITYNLMLSTILGFLVNGAYSLVHTIFSSLPKGINKKAVSAGIISFLLVSFAGNFHTPIYAFQKGIDKYWYPDATRFIGYNPDTNDKTIHEFPLYSFVVSDLHAHLLGIPIVILYLSFLFMIFGSSENITFRKRIPFLLFPGFLFGLMFMTNTWDFASYMLITGVCLVMSRISLFKDIGNISQAVYDISLNIIILLVIGLITALPFILNFESIAEGVQFVTSRSPVWQLLILWGLPILLLVFFSAFIIAKKKAEKSDLFILGLLVSSILLIIIPEIIYVKDIYIASHYRANTMFKITYQAFVIGYLSSGYVALRIITGIKNIPFRILSTTVFTLLFSAMLTYPFFAVNSYFDKLENKTGLNGETWIKNTYPSTYRAIEYLRNTVSEQKIITEASGNSYTDYNVISSYTGLPTIQGWFVHEWLWRGSAELPSERVSDLEILYTSKNINEVKKIIEKYKVNYLIYGFFEKEKYPNNNELLIDSLRSEEHTSELQSH